MKKIKFILFSILICLIICDKKTKKAQKHNSKYNNACLMSCLRRIKKPARTAQNCIISEALLNALKSNPWVIVTTVTGLKTAIENCKQYIDHISSSMKNLEKECRQKCRKKK